MCRRAVNMLICMRMSDASCFMHHGKNATKKYRLNDNVHLSSNGTCLVDLDHARVVVGDTLVSVRYTHSHTHTLLIITLNTQLFARRAYSH